MGAGSQQTGSTPQSGSSLPPLLAQKSVATLLRTYLETGMSHNQQRLHKVKYFQELLATNPDVPDSLRPLLKLSRETIVRRQKTDYALISSLQRDPILAERVKN